MPTQPLKDVLDPDLAIATAKPLIDIASPLLGELVNHGTSAMVRCATSSENKENEDLAVIALYRHALEMTDGIEVLIRQACVTPAIPALRSLFEAFVSMKFIISDKDKYVQRSIAWIVNHVHRRLTMYKMLDPGTPEGVELQKAIANDETVKSFPFPPRKPVNEAIANLEKLLKQPQFAQISHDLSGVKHWYHLNNGPNDLRSLSHAVGEPLLYDYMYRLWSKTAHAEEFARFIAKGPDGDAGVRAMRDTSDLKSISSHAATIMLRSTRLLIGWFRPDEDISAWYKREIQSLYLKITSP